MVDYEAIAEALRAGLWAETGLLFVSLENGDPRPDTDESLPSDLHTFMSYKFTSPYINGAKHEEFADDTLTQVEQFTATLSITVYSKTKAGALALAVQARNWFEYAGYEYLEDNNIVCERTETIGDRTAFMDTNYDHRVGFDAILRLVNETSKTTTSIDRVTINGELIGE